MKYSLFFTSILISSFCIGQTDTLLLKRQIVNITNQITQVVAIKTDSTLNTGAPYMRISTNTPLSLSPSWQNITFGIKNSQQDTDRFAIDSTTSKRYVWYDTTSLNRLIRISMLGDANFLITLYVNSTTIGVATKATVQYRFVIPNGVSPGVDYYFPFPNNGGYEDWYDATLLNLASVNSSKLIPVYLTSILRANGMYMQMRLSNGLVALGSCTLNSAALLIQQTK